MTKKQVIGSAAAGIFTGTVLTVVGKTLIEVGATVLIVGSVGLLGYTAIKTLKIEEVSK